MPDAEPKPASVQPRGRDSRRSIITAAFCIALVVLVAFTLIRARIASDLDQSRDQVLSTHQAIAALRELGAAVRSIEWELPTLPANGDAADGRARFYRRRVDDLASTLARARNSQGGDAAWRQRFAEVCKLAASEVEACDALLNGVGREESPAPAVSPAAAVLQIAADFRKRADDLESDGLRLAGEWERQAASLSSHQRHTVAIAALVEDLILAVSYFLVRRQLVQMKQFATEVRESEQKYRLLADNSTDLICRHDLAGNYLYASPASTSLLGVEADQMRGRAPTELVHPEDRPAFINCLTSAAAGWRPVVTSYRIRRGDGRWVWVEMTSKSIRDPDTGETVEVLSTCRDVTARKSAERALAESECFARATVDALTTQVAILDEAGKVLSVNKAWEKFSHEAGRPTGRGVGQVHLQFYDTLGAAHAKYGSALASGIRLVISGELSIFEHEFPWTPPTPPSTALIAVPAATPAVASGAAAGAVATAAPAPKRRWFLARVSRFPGQTPTRVVIAHEDVTDLRIAAERLRHDSLHDALTGLPNRTLFRDRVQRCIERSRRYQGYQFAVLFLDLDRFKVINDSLGHAAGDQFLVMVARRLQLCLRGTDSSSRVGEANTVARLGGDEFTVLLEDLRSPGDAVRVAERILEGLSRPCMHEGHELSTTVSIGIASNSPAHITAKDMLRDADAAMYRAKESGKARYVLFNDSMHESAIDRLRVESDLRRALERNELLLHYQPIVSLTDGRVQAFEALIRWKHGEILVNPGDFIPIAEDIGLIIPIGRWVLQEACRQNKAWQAAGHAPVRVAVNVSAMQFAQDNFVSTVDAALKASGLDPRWLQVELTESLLMDDMKTAAAKLAEIRARGVLISIDDFGTGYSSLAYLQRLPIDTLKVDRSFVRELTPGSEVASPGNAVIIRSIASLAHNLGMKVVAEGVETDAQRDFLAAIGCHEMQGFLYSAPVAAEQAEAFLSRQDAAARLATATPTPLTDGPKRLRKSA